MAANHFEQIAEELLKQKQLMDKLEAENRELRAQIADLRSGRGICVDINGIRFALRDDSTLGQTTSASSAPANTSLAESTVADPTPPIDQHIVDAPTEAMPEIIAQQEEQSIKEPVSASNNDGDNNVTSEGSTFLEEILIDEFASALTSPKAIWQDPAEKKPSNQQRKEPIDEKQKETLRRELTGSYLLE